MIMRRRRVQRGNVITKQRHTEREQPIKLIIAVRKRVKLTIDLFFLFLLLVFLLFKY